MSYEKEQGWDTHFPYNLINYSRIKLKKEWLKSICLKYDHKFGYKFGEKYLEKMRKVVYNDSTRI